MGSVIYATLRATVPIGNAARHQSDVRQFHVILGVTQEILEAETVLNTKAQPSPRPQQAPYLRQHAALDCRWLALPRHRNPLQHAVHNNQVKRFVKPG